MSVIRTHGAPSSEPDAVADRASGGDDDDHGLDRVYRRLRRLAAVAGAHDNDPDDLVQEAFARALAQRPLDQFDDLEAYLCRTIFNLASNGRRKRTRGRRAIGRLERSTPSPSPDDTSIPPDLQILEQLSVPSRTVVYLVDVEGFSFAEAASLMGCSPLAARSRASRARRQLRSILEGMDDA